MAEEALKKLEEQLKCSICLHTYTDPKQLQCHHVFCEKCLGPLVVQDRQQRLSLTCPNCRQITPIPGRGVVGLQSAFHISSLLEVQESFKDLKNPAATLKGAAGGATAEVPSKTELRCFQHSKTRPDLYCETCEELVCVQCIMKGGKHRDHDTALMETAFDKHRGEILSAFELMEQQVETTQQALVQLDRSSEDICDQRTNAEDKIHSTFGQLRGILDVRETELVAKLNQITEGKMKGLAAQRDEVETTLAQLSSCLHFMKESFKMHNKAYLLKMKKTVKKVKDLTTPFQQHSWKPNVEADTHVVFTSPPADTPLTTACENYGEIVTMDELDPSRCSAAGDGLSVAVVGEKSTVHLTTAGENPKPFKSLECMLTSELSGNCSVEKRGLASYDISYQPTVKGRHHLIIKAGGQHIPGSPFSIVATSPLEKLGTLMLIVREVEEPQGIAINQKGEVVVTKDKPQCVSVFSPSGVKLRSFGTCGDAQGQFLHPCGVTVDGEDNILIVDKRKHCILKFATEGQFVTQVGTEGSGPLQFSSPVDIAYNSSNNCFYVLDMGNMCVQVLNSDLTFSNTFGKAGKEAGQFGEVLSIACSRRVGNVFVADIGKQRIHVFSAEGRFLRMFGRNICSPMDVCIDDQHRVYVSERCSDNVHRVSVFTEGGQFLTSFQWTPSQEADFEDYFIGLAIDSNGVVYACDSDNDCIQIFY